MLGGDSSAHLRPSSVSPPPQWHKPPRPVTPPPNGKVANRLYLCWVFLVPSKSMLHYIPTAKQLHILYQIWNLTHNSLGVHYLMNHSHFDQEVTSILLDTSLLSNISFRPQISIFILEFCSVTSSLSRQASLHLAWKKNWDEIRDIHWQIKKNKKNSINQRKYREVFDFSRQVSDRLVQLTAEVSGLVHQIEDNVL